MTILASFDIFINMEINIALSALSGLAQESRLSIFRALVQRGPEGLAAGEIAGRCGIPAPTLSFHLAHLLHVGLVTRRRKGRSLIYAARFDTMRDLVGYLTENCCGGRRSCAPEETSCNPASGANGLPTPAGGMRRHA